MYVGPQSRYHVFLQFTFLESHRNNETGVSKNQGTAIDPPQSRALIPKTPTNRTMETAK